MNYYENLPPGWALSRLEYLSINITKGTTPRGGESFYSKHGVAFLRVENIKGLFTIDHSNMKFIDENTHLKFLQRSILQSDDILISIAGTLGRTALVQAKDLPMNINQAISFVRLVNKNKLLIKYIIYAINSPSIQQKLIKQKKITAIPNLTLEIIRKCFIPIPPIFEQGRIIRKLDLLLEFIENQI